MEAERTGSRERLIIVVYKEEVLSGLGGKVGDPCGLLLLLALQLWNMRHPAGSLHLGCSKRSGKVL